MPGAVKNALVPSRIPGVDYVINPYVGCHFGCKFCYASFMGRFVERGKGEWGTFVSPKEGMLSALVRQLRRPQKFYGKTVLIGSVTDPYQPVEARRKLTRGILEILMKLAPAIKLEILTRSPLVLRDADLFRSLGVVVNVSVSVMGEEYFREVEPISPPVKVRLNVLKRLRDMGVRTGAFVAPVFPDALDEFRKIISELKDNGIPVVHVELLSPFKNPGLRSLDRFPEWIRLIKTPGIYDRFVKVLFKYYPDVRIVRHGWL